MSKLTALFPLLLIVACGPSNQEIQNTATITCNIMAATRGMDAAIRIREINAAREKIGEPAFLDLDEDILLSLKYDLCESLVRNDDDYESKLAKQRLEEARELVEQKQVRERVEQQQARERAEQRQQEARELAEQQLQEARELADRKKALIVLGIRARIARLQAEIDEIPFTSIPGFPEEHQGIVDDEILLYRSRQQELGSSLSILKQQRTQYEQSLVKLYATKYILSRNAALAKKELEITAPLVESGAVSQVELLRLQAAVNDSLGQLEETGIAIPEAEALLAKANLTIKEYSRPSLRSNAKAELIEAQREFNRLKIPKPK